MVKVSKYSKALEMKQIKNCKFWNFQTKFKGCLSIANLTWRWNFYIHFENMKVSNQFSIVLIEVLVTKTLSDTTLRN